MPRPHPALIRTLAAVAAALLARPLAAQAVDRTVRGQVTTREGVPVIASTLWLVDTAAAARDSSIAATTDENGRFRFTLPLKPTSALVARRLGFGEAAIALGPSLGKRTIDVRPLIIDPRAAPAMRVVVRDSGVYTGPNAAFFRHLASGRGQYVTYAQLQRSDTRTSNALRMIPGLTLVPGGGGTTVRMRGRSCYVAIWIDGAPLGVRAFDVDGIPVQSLLGIEFYGNGSTPPIEFQTPESASCGALAFWTRRTEMGGIPEQGTVHDAATLRYASDVDQPARPADDAQFAPRYPDEARSAGIGGSVIVDLVVDATGLVERSSISVAAASAPELADPVVMAVRGMRFTPARAGGVAVRQLVHLEAQFTPSRTARNR